MIALPLSLDGLIVTAVIVFSFSWNEALFASALTSQDAATLPSFILASRSTRGVDFNFAAVNTILAIGPPVILSFFVQRYLARGLSFGAVKAEETVAFDGVRSGNTLGGNYHSGPACGDDAGTWRATRP